MTDDPRRLLIVDDDEAIRRALQRTLRGEGYELTFAASAAEALDLLSLSSFDVVMSDHLMPNMTGIEFLKIVRNRYPDTLRVMLTGHAETQMAIDAINHGEIYRFLTKPWDNTELKVMLFIAFEHLAEERRRRELRAKATWVATSTQAPAQRTSERSSKIVRRDLVV